MLKEKLEQDLKSAMLAKNSVRVSTLKLIKSAVLYKEVELGSRDSGLTEEQIIEVLGKEAKKRREAAEMYQNGGRPEQAAAEIAELAIINEYLPSQMSNEELQKIISSVISETGASSMQDMGKVIGAVKAKVGATSDGSRIAEIVKVALSNQ